MLGIILLSYCLTKECSEKFETNPNKTMKYTLEDLSKAINTCITCGFDNPSNHQVIEIKKHTKDPTQFNLELSIFDKQKNCIELYSATVGIPLRKNSEYKLKRFKKQEYEIIGNGLDKKSYEASNNVSLEYLQNNSSCQFSNITVTPNIETGLECNS